MPFAGDFRPYFTIYDTDFNVFAESLGSGQRPTPGAPLPPVILGVTNPFFLKSFDRFPNIISLGQGEHNVHSHEMGKTGSLESRESSGEDDRGELSSLFFGRACAIITKQHTSFETAAARSQ